MSTTRVTAGPVWNELTAQQLVRYEALFRLLGDLQGLDDVAEIGRRVATQWKYFANVAGWRMALPNGDGFLLVDGQRGMAVISTGDALPRWDERFWMSQRPTRLAPPDPEQDGPLDPADAPPPHLTGRSVREVMVMPFMRADRCVALLSVAARHTPLTDMDIRFIQIFGGFLADLLTSILLRRQTIDLLVARATRDALTGLLNRAAVIDQMVSRLEQSQACRIPIGVILADLDFFKKVNDTYGHLTGDHVLREVSGLLDAATRPNDAVGRYGGEEFLMVLYPCYPGDVERVAERLRAAVAAATFYADGDPDTTFGLTVSIGAASAHSVPGMGPQDLLRWADEALYRSKAGGRDRVTVSHCLSATRVAR